MTSKELTESELAKKQEFLLISIDRMIPVLNGLVKDLSRTVLLQAMFAVISLLILFNLESLPEGNIIGPISYDLAMWTIPLFLTKLFVDWGYKSYHYLVVRGKLEYCLGVYYDIAGDEVLDKQDFTSIFIPTSVFTTFYGANPENDYSEHRESNWIQYFFLVLLVCSFAASNSIAVYFSYTQYPLGWNLFVTSMMVAVFAVGYGHYYSKVKNTYNEKFLAGIVTVHLIFSIIVAISFPVST